MTLSLLDATMAEAIHDAVLNAGELDAPANISLLRLPSCAPELNAVENIWRYLRQNHLANRVFDTDACRHAWNARVAQPRTITSIATRDWAKAVNA